MGGRVVEFRQAQIYGGFMKRITISVLSVLLALALAAPTLANAGTAQSKAIKNSQKQWKKISKQQNKEQKKQLKAQQKQMKKWNKNNHTTITTT